VHDRDPIFKRAFFESSLEAGPTTRPNLLDKLGITTDQFLDQMVQRREFLLE
jgi:hypothetical protein